jgi:predicted nucleotidyltransferase
MKKDLQKILIQLRELNPVLQNEYKVKKIELFGSYFSNHQNTDSDLDILVSFSETPGLLKFIELENFLSDKIGIKVDLVMKDAVKPRLRNSIINNSLAI